MNTILLIFLLTSNLACISMEREHQDEPALVWDELQLCQVDTTPFADEDIIQDCVTCGNIFLSSQEYQSHLPCVVIKNNAPKKSKVLTAVLEQFKCTGCLRHFSSERNVDRHVRTVHHTTGTNPYILDLKNLRSFLVTKTSFTCFHCNKIFNEKGAYLKHKISGGQTECASQSTQNEGMKRIV